jgi:putative acetyltransferase
MQDAATRFSIRPESPGDFPAVWNVHREAFGRDDEANLVEQLRTEGFARVSLVATRGNLIVGHVLFSQLAIVTPEGPIAGLSLAPLAVLPEFQAQGAGSQLCREGLTVCRAQQHRIVIVLGHADYYPRFGFSPELALPLESPYAGPSFMAAELVPGALTGVRGRVVYPPPFGEA